MHVEAQRLAPSRACSLVASSDTEMVIGPGGPNLIALLSKLCSTCRTATGSSSTRRGTDAGTWMTRFWWRCRASSEKLCKTSSSIAAGSQCRAITTRSAAASDGTVIESRMSNRYRLLAWTVRSRADSSSIAPRDSRRISIQPTTLASAPRSSWLKAAKKLIPFSLECMSKVTNPLCTGFLRQNRPLVPHIGAGGQAEQALRKRW